MKKTRMQIQSMSKPFFHTTEQFDTTIYCFMSRQYLFSLLGSVGKVKIVVIPVSSIGYGFFSRQKTIDESISSKSEIWPFSTWNTSVSPNNVPGAYTNCYFISQTGAIEFVRPPFRIKLGWFHDLKVCSIKRNESGCACWSNLETFFPIQLLNKY